MCLGVSYESACLSVLIPNFSVITFALFFSLLYSLFTIDLEIIDTSISYFQQMAIS